MRPFRTRGSRLVVGLVVAVGALVTTASPAFADGPTVTGGGASFPSLLINQWRADVARAPFNLRINYSSAGSGFGRDKFISGALDFGQSDIAFLDDELPRVRAAGRDFVYVPVVAGALAFMFNVTGTDGRRITNLRLTANDVCRIFTEPVMRWNDPSIVATNPGLPLPSELVRPVVRSDRSGTSYVLSEFCIARAPQVWSRFIAFIGSGNYGQDQYLTQRRPISQWPSGYSPQNTVSQAFASDGVASAVANSSTGQNSITYIETGYTKVKRLPAAKVQNAVGVFTPPLPANSTVALGFARPIGDGTFKLSYTGADPRAYFPSTYSYTIAQTRGFDPAKGKVLATYLNYAVCRGQDRAERLLYSRLSSVLVNIALDATAKIPGAPPRPRGCSAPPPPRLVITAPRPNVQGATATNGAAGGAAGGAAAGGSASGASGAALGGATAGGAAAGGALGGATGGSSGGVTAPGGATTAGSVDGAVTPDGVPVDAAAGGGVEVASGAAPVDGGPGGPENSEVLFTLALGAALVGAGTAAAKGSRKQ